MRVINHKTDKKGKQRELIETGRTPFSARMGPAQQMEWIIWVVFTFSVVWFIAETLQRTIRHSTLSETQILYKLFRWGSSLFLVTIACNRLLVSIFANSTPIIVGNIALLSVLGFGIRQHISDVCCALVFTFCPVLNTGATILLRGGGDPIEGTVEQLGLFVVHIRDVHTKNITVISNLVLYNSGFTVIHMN